MSSHAVGDLCLEGDHPTALVLESPFSNIKDEVKFHPLSSVSLHFSHHHFRIMFLWLNWLTDDKCRCCPSGVPQDAQVRVAVPQTPSGIGRRLPQRWTHRSHTFPGSHTTCWGRLGCPLRARPKGELPVIRVSFTSSCKLERGKRLWEIIARYTV